MKTTSRRALLQALLGALAPTACRRADTDSAPRPTPRAIAPPPPPPGGILPDGRWNPSRTWVFAVGILTWRNPEYTSFPVAGRQDVELVSRLRARGVPDAQIVFITDGDATRDALLRALTEMVSRTRPGDLVWFYYAGHGVIDAAGTLYFIPHDTGDDLAASAWSLPSVLAAIEGAHRGPMFLTADCCHSGALVDAVRARRSIPSAALASSLSSEESTGTWTFTECLLAGLSNEVPSAAGGVAPLTLDALADFTIARMANEEEQLATFAAGPGFPAGMRLGTTAPPPRDPRLGAYVEARSEGVWYRGRVVDVRDDGHLRVHYGGYNHDQDEWLAPDAVRPYAPVHFANGAAVEAEWRGRWYPATVRDARYGIHYVHYDGFDDAWDEWVSSRRIRAPGGRVRRRRA